MLLAFEAWKDDASFVRQQVAFCARWLLENMFEAHELIPVESSHSSVIRYSNESELVDLEAPKKIDLTLETGSEHNQLTNAILLPPDAGSYAKLSPCGLEARCDASSFESVRCSFVITSGVWYYECELLTGGVMQIGLAGCQSRFLSDEGCGVGDDRFSVAYDGCRQKIWYDARPTPLLQNSRMWKSGDIVGCLIDFNAKLVYFFLNEKLVACNKEVFACSPDGLYAAASLMSFQQCRFNFGSKPFRHPPIGKQFETFEKNAKLSDDQRQQFLRQRRRRLKLKEMQMPSFKDDACPLCCDSPGNVKLMPCEHGGFCDTCAAQLQFCPLCRGSIEGWEQQQQQRATGEPNDDCQSIKLNDLNKSEPETEALIESTSAVDSKSNVKSTTTPKETKANKTKALARENRAPR